MQIWFKTEWFYSFLQNFLLSLSSETDANVSKNTNTHRFTQELSHHRHPENMKESLNQKGELELENITKSKDVFPAI